MPYNTFERGTKVAIKVWFFIFRPQSDFIADDRTRGLKARALADTRFVTKVPDLDNYLKFILDCLTDLFYVDDKQVVSIKSYKLLDNEAMCHGRTKIQLSVFNENEFEEPTF